MELQNLLTQDSDKLTHAKEVEQMENVITQMTTQLKQSKQEAHLNKLELQKSQSLFEEIEFENKKLRKDNDFLKNRIESLEIEKQEIISK